jgi:23S rRNA (cytidine1920-2'-O)/16S rRNA (cytidine1409-2'-O)-methyltransferase
MDVSFISATYIIPAIKRILAPGSDFICLIKPQFEVGKSGLGKGGIVKSAKFRREAVDKVVKFAEENGFKCHSVIESPIIGGDGNIEFLAYFQNGEQL